MVRALPNEGRAVLVHPGRVTVVRADYVAEKSAGGFAHELATLCPHVENDPVTSVTRRYDTFCISVT